MRDTLDMSAAEQRFEQILLRLRELGWDNHRVDTLTHPSHDGFQRHLRPTIRYGYSGGEWWITCEPDRNWRKPHPDAEPYGPQDGVWEGVTVRLAAGKPLPEVDEALQTFWQRLLGE